jgi:serine O-acetyltransferase
MNKLWRIGNHLSKMGWVPRKISRILELINHLICACSVSIDAEIGNRTIFYHRGIGCVVHPKAVIGEDCKIFQGVIGSKWSKASCLGEAPRIGNNVMIGAGAVILGNITIGDDSIIGANAVVTHSIPKNSLAVGVPAIIKKL